MKRLRAGLATLHPKVFFLESWKEIDARRTPPDPSGKAPFDYRPLIVLCVGAVSLTLMEYFGHSRAFRQLLEALAGDGSAFDSTWSEGKWSIAGFAESLRRHPFLRFFDYVWWSGWRVLGYFLIPILSLKLMGERVRDYGLSFQGLGAYAPFYALAYAVVLVLVVIVSYSPEFSGYYPFYKNASRSWAEFVGWEVLYAAQFFSLEFFFRGYWLHACERSLGSGAIFAMVVPYCMIHFGKPWLEALGAIIAGVVLGTLALRTRSIWSGFFIHVAVAVSMDVAALLQTRGLPSQLWPNV